jgi:adenylate cyclase
VVRAAREGRTDQTRQWFNGKIVLIGTDAIDDRYPTPFFTAFSGPRWTMAGVEIHANTLDTLLTRNFLTYVPPAAGFAANLATAATVASILLLAPTAAVLSVLTAIAAILLSTHLLFRAGIVLSTSELILTCALAVVFTIVYRFLVAQRRGDMFRKAMGLFVDQRLAASLEDSEGVAISATHAFVTVLFSDIRGFTAFSESRNPADVVTLLNEYLTQMVRIIMSHGGSVNKFLGDGILAVFSDQDGPQLASHSERAVRCGIEMCSAPSRFETGVGIHTGLVVIGNIGSADRMEYTMLGDTVNVASRIEGLNKEEKTQLLISEATNVLLEEQIETVHLREAQIRGYSQPLNIYTVAALYRKKRVSSAGASP